jgi:hypothetical protein
MTTNAADSPGIGSPSERRAGMPMPTGHCGQETSPPVTSPVAAPVLAGRTGAARAGGAPATANSPTMSGHRHTARQRVARPTTASTMASSDSRFRRFSAAGVKTTSRPPKVP